MNNIIDINWNVNREIPNSDLPNFEEEIPEGLIPNFDELSEEDEEIPEGLIPNFDELSEEDEDITDARIPNFEEEEEVLDKEILTVRYHKKMLSKLLKKIEELQKKHGFSEDESMDNPILKQGILDVMSELNGELNNKNKED